MRNDLLLQAGLSGLQYFFSHKLITLNAEKFSRETRPKLYELCENLCEKAGLPKPQLYLLNGSYMNAMTTGGRNNFVILISQPFLDTLTEDEIEAIISHEIGHTLLGHVSSNIMCHFFVGILTSLGSVDFLS